MAEIASGFLHILTAPFKSVEALWLIIPLFVMWFILEIYFAKYKKEKLGWNTALANGITLGWLTLEGMRHIFSARPDDLWIRFGGNAIILLYAMMIIYFSFTHLISPKLNFLMASPTPVYFLGVFSVSWGYGTLEMNWFILIDLILLFILISIFFAIFRRFVKPAQKEVEAEETELSKAPGMPEMPGMGEGGLPEMPSMPGMEQGPGEGMGGMPPMPKF